MAEEAAFISAMPSILLHMDEAGGKWMLVEALARSQLCISWAGGKARHPNSVIGAATWPVFLRMLFLLEPSQVSRFPSPDTELPGESVQVNVGELRLSPSSLPSVPPITPALPHLQRSGIQAL